METLARKAIKEIANTYEIGKIIDAYLRKDKFIIVCEGNQKFWYNFATEMVCKSVIAK